MDEVKLLPCPFCGSEETYRHEADEDIIGAVAIGCSSCGALGSFYDIDDFSGKPEAFEAAEIAWNTRTRPPIGTDEVVKLKEWAFEKSRVHHQLAHDNEHLRTEHIASSAAYRELALEIEARLKAIAAMPAIDQDGGEG